MPDVRARLPGRGVWVSADRAALKRAVEKKLFAKSLKRAVTVPEGIIAETERLLCAYVLELLGLANKAGLVRAGYMKASELIGSGSAALVLEAADAAHHGREKIGRLAKNANVPVVTLFTVEELGLALGRGNVVHAALGAGRISGRLMDEVGRLAAFRDIQGSGKNDVGFPLPGGAGDERSSRLRTGTSEDKGEA